MTGGLVPIADAPGWFEDRDGFFFHGDDHDADYRVLTVAPDDEGIAVVWGLLTCTDDDCTAQRLVGETYDLVANSHR